VTVEVEVRPTESREKVMRALRNLFEPQTVRVERLGESEVIVAESTTLASLTKLYYALRAERILDAARGALKKGVQAKDRLVFHLHKQAAYTGKVSFVDGDNESPLGAIRFVVEHPDVKAVIDWLAPYTVRGRPVFEREMPE
jgi:predicted RNA binding protein with dsRBD fold (UPF0201 family)